MKNEQSRIREAVRKINVADKWLIDNAIVEFDNRVEAHRELRAKRRDRAEAVEELIDACRKYLKPGG